ncbi:MAG: flagellar export chaperone FliS [Calditrichota bacterium]
MKLNTGHTLYKQVDVACSGPQLVLLLCDGVIRYAREAAEHLRAGRWAEKGQAVEAAYECLSELRKGLDFEHGGDTAFQLDRMYDFLSTKLTYANATRDPQQFEQIVEAVKPIRAAWEDLFSRLKAEGRLTETTANQAAMVS